MATRIEDILVRCRDSLADEDESRWSDARLLRLVDEAQKKIATKAQLLRKSFVLPLIANINEYALPSDAFLLTRAVSADGAKIGLTTHSALDDMMSNAQLCDCLRINNISSDAEWEYDTGTEVQYIIFDNQEPGKIKTYPIVTELDGTETFLTSPTAFGVVTSVEDDIITSVYGVVTTIATNAINTAQFSSVYGIVTAMSSVEETIKIYYRAKPVTITAVTDPLEIDDKWDAAIKHYVIGMALHDDQDTQNRAVSSDEIGLYGVEFAEAKEVSAKDHTSRSSHRTSYNSEI